jgi:hypothetical protein
MISGRLENLAGAGHGGAIGNDLQVLVAKGRSQVLGLTAAYNQLPPASRELRRHCASNTARRAGYQSDFVHVESLAGFIVVLDEVINSG